MSEYGDFKQQTLNTIQQYMDQRQRQVDRLESLLQVFTEDLYTGFEEAIAFVRDAGIESIQTPQFMNHPAGGWRRVMQLNFEDWRIIVVPLIGAAWPNLQDEAMIPGAAFKEPCGRLAFFLLQEEDNTTTAFYDVIVLLNGAWFAWGYGWPKQQDSVEATNFTNLALDLLTSFTKDIHLTWAIRDTTTLVNALDPKRRAYEFGLPGEE